MRIHEGMAEHQKQMFEEVQRALLKRRIILDGVPKKISSDIIKDQLGKIGLHPPFYGFLQTFQAEREHYDELPECREQLKLGQQWLLCSDFQGAYDYLKEGLGKALINHDQDGCIQALNGLMVATSNLNRPLEAIAYGIETLTFVELSKYWDGEVEGIYTNLAQAFFSLCEYGLSAELSSYAVLLSLANKSYSTLSQSLACLSEAYRNATYKEEAVIFGKLAYQNLEFTPPYLKSHVEITYASALNRVGEWSEALALCQTSLNRNKELPDFSNNIRALILKGTIHTNLEDINLTLESYHLALDLSRQIGHLRYEMDCLSSLGCIYLHLHDTELAFDYLRQSVRVEKQLGTFSFHLPQMLYIATCYRMIGKLDHAEKMLEILFYINQIENQGGGMIFCLLEITEVLIQKGELEKALLELSKAARICKLLVSRNSYLEGIIYLKISELHMKIGDRENAIYPMEMVGKAFGNGFPFQVIAPYFVVRSWLNEPKGKMAVSETLYKGLERLQNLSKNLPYSIGRQWLGLSGTEILFEKLIDLESDSLPAVEVYYLCQQARSRRLKELLSKSEMKPPANVPSVLIEQEKILLTETRERIGSLIDPASSYWEALDQSDYESKIAELQEIWGNMRPLAPAYVDLREGGTPSLSQLLNPMR